MGSANSYRSGIFKTELNAPLVYPTGEGELDFIFLPAGGQFHLRYSDEALTPYGGIGGVGLGRKMNPVV